MPRFFHDVGVVHAGGDLLLDAARVVGAEVVLVVERAPGLAFHLGAHDAEHAFGPADDVVEVAAQLVDVGVVAVLLHVVGDVAARHPFEGVLQDALVVGFALHVGVSFLHVRVRLVGELGAGGRDEGPGIDGVEFLLLVDLYAADVDDLEPLFDLRLRPFADIGDEHGLADALLLLVAQRGEFEGQSAFHHAELVREEASEAGDALLSVEHFEASVGEAVEVEQPEGIAFEHGVDDGGLLLSLSVFV